MANSGRIKCYWVSRSALFGLYLNALAWYSKQHISFLIFCALLQGSDGAKAAKAFFQRCCCARDFGHNLSDQLQYHSPSTLCFDLSHSVLQQPLQWVLLEDTVGNWPIRVWLIRFDSTSWGHCGPSQFEAGKKYTKTPHNQGQQIGSQARAITTSAH